MLTPFELDGPLPPWSEELAHPIAREFPDIAAETFQDLIASMRRDGYKPEHPVVWFESKILEGNTRYRAAAVAGVRPVMVNFTGHKWHALEFVFRENLLRRHLEIGERLALIDRWNALRKQTVPPKPAKLLAKTTDGVSSDTPDKSVRKRAAEHHVPVRSQAKFDRIKAVDADGELRKKLISKKITLNAAFNAAKKIEAKVAEPEPVVPPSDPAERPIEARSEKPLTEGAAAFKAIRNRAIALRQELKELCQGPWGRLLDENAIHVEITNIVNALRYCAPYTSCPMGDPCDTDCRLCGGSQWVGERQWDGVPKELKK